MKSIVIIVSLALIPAVSAQDVMPPPEDPAWHAGLDEFHLSADDWARPRQADRVADMRPVRRAVRAWMDAPGATLAVIYPGGETGRLWGNEVRDWLVSLGVEADSIDVRAGSPREDTVVLRIQEGR